jgi:hypothetical protein
MKIFTTLFRLVLPFFVASGMAADAGSPFELSIVPSRGQRIEVRSEAPVHKADKWRFVPRTFYVVMTNVSKEAQPIFETSNSWGYDNVSFEITLADGKKVAATIRPQVFTVNFPGTSPIPAGEKYVYAVQLDEKWEFKPHLLALGEQQITIKAIYETKKTDQSAERKVWVGRVESKEYKLNLFRYDAGSKD